MYKEVDGEFYFMVDGVWVHEMYLDIIYAMKQDSS